MRKKGYVTMYKDTRDGRQTVVALTESGRAAYDRAAPVMAQRRAALRDVFSQDEIHAFAGFLDRLEEFLRIPTTELLANRKTQEDAQ
jgi:DNA-binding MarR family transcriptional regulator